LGDIILEIYRSGPHLVVRPFEGSPLCILPSGELVEGAHLADETIALRPEVNVGRELVRLLPDYLDPCLGRERGKGEGEERSNELKGLTGDMLLTFALSSHPPCPLLTKSSATLLTSSLSKPLPISSFLQSSQS